MALVAHTIVSRYTPQQRDPIIDPVAPEEDLWRTESPFGTAQRLYSRAAPYFVAASLEYDEYGMPKSDAHDHMRSQIPKQSDTIEDVGTWYRNLTSRGDSRKEDDTLGVTPSRSLSSDLLPHTPEWHPLPVKVRPTSTSLRRTATNWFTSSLQPSASIHTQLQHSSKPSTFSDMLSRNPPPLPTEPAFKPPVFLALGPDNRGFTMLQRKGWREGEGLGSARVERIRNTAVGGERKSTHISRRTVDGEGTDSSLNQSKHSVEHAVPPLIHEGKEVIDLTHSDSENDEDHEVVDLTLSDSQFEPETEPEDVEEPSKISEHQDTPPHGTMLLTPLPTTLKADRLGIGLKARRRQATAKAKAITHTSSALAAHIRSANKMRKDKAKYGRGSRGFGRGKRKEERARVAMLAYMKS